MLRLNSMTGDAAVKQYDSMMLRLNSMTGDAAVKQYAVFVSDSEQSHCAFARNYDTET
jgi:hypothetical protein